MPDDTELRLRITGEDPASRLRSLHRWLGNEDDLRGRVELRNRPIAPGEMGGVADVLAVALSAGGAGTVLLRSLARSVSTWLAQSRADVSVTVTTTGDTREVKVDVQRARDPEAVLRGIEELLEPGRSDRA
jgi:hypothetical protein